MTRNICRIDLPSRADSCLIADSPHSGRDYPDDFAFSCTQVEARQAEDALVDQLYDFLPDLGVAFLQAQFPRAYIDVNRPDDISPQFMQAPGGVYRPANTGTIRATATPWSDARVNAPMPLGEAFARANDYWRPYHAALDVLADDAHARHGRVVLADLHSMLAHVGRKGEANRYDIAIGAHPVGGRPAARAETSGYLMDAFGALGYRTVLNHKDFSGAEIVRRHGRPPEGREAVLIEVNRGLYFDDKTLEKSAGFDETRANLKKVMTGFSDFLKAPRALP